MMRLLVAYDGSESADAALLDLQRAGLPHDTEALVVSVADVIAIPDVPNYEFAAQALTSRRVTTGLLYAEAQRGRVLQEAQTFASQGAKQLHAYFPDWEVRPEMLVGSAAVELIRKADEWKPDLVVLGSHGHSTLGRLLLGSVSKRLVTESHHSVRVARGGTRNGKPPKLVIGVDGSAGAERAVCAVGSRVWPAGTEVRIITVNDGTPATGVARILPVAGSMIQKHNEESKLAAEKMVNWAEGALSTIGLNVSVAVERGDPKTVLIREAQKWDADAIFVGGRRFSNTLERIRLGSVATSLVTKAHSSVEVVR